MYKLLLSWRYLRTRFIALASIISVTLGVATLIIVNSVMAGFTNEMYVRLHGILADVILEAHSQDGFPDPHWHIDEIRKVVGSDLEGITTAVHVPAMVSITLRGQYITRQVNLVGVDEATYAEVSDFRQYLLHPENREKVSFLLREGGYGSAGHDMPPSGWKYRRMRVEYQRELEKFQREQQPAAAPAADDLAGGIPAPPSEPGAVKAGAEAERGRVFDEMTEQRTGIVLGIAIGSVRQRNTRGEVQDFFLCRPGDDVIVAFASAGSPPKVLNDKFTVVDFYESKMSEYDSGFAFVPLRKLQELRGMIDPMTGMEAVTTIQLKLKPGADLTAVRDKLRARFPQEEFPYRIQTWKDMQGPLLAAVQMETTLLNILLFLIIAVAGFGILATFYMIVVEKTKDIGVLKALGASSRGVMGIFLGYGLSLGAVGSGVGMVLGLLFVAYINRIAEFIELVTGQEVFDPTVYYFQKIPTIVHPQTVVGVVIGSMIIAVLASVLPALRAARLHPVEALRYE
jgi:lipoprotein-releasing system permease protein